MHAYRTHNCGELRLSDDGQQVRLSGWIHRKRDHGDLMFVDLRDNFGLTQVVADVSSMGFVEIEAASLESVICVTGKVLKRTADTINTSLPTGEVELQIESFEVLSSADTLPMPVNQDAGYPPGRAAQ
jgi:aspartyl-tRNA synthetase